jgi:hypothetical protein
MKKIIALAASAALSAALSPSSHAVTLGELHVASFLGQRLSGVVEVKNTEGAALTTACFQAIKSREAEEQGLPWISKVTVNLEKRTDKLRLILTSAQPIDEPILGLAIQLGCGIDTSRDYLLMLSPPPSIDNVQVSKPVSPARIEPPAEQPVARKRPAEPKPVKSAPATGPAHTWIIGKGESVSSLASALYPDNAKMRKAFAQAVFQANPDLVMDYSSRDTLPQGLVLAVPDLKKLANTPAAIAPAADEITRPTQTKTNESPTPGSTKPNIQENEEMKSDRLLVSEIGDADAYPGDLVFRKRLEASRQELHQLSRFVESSLPASNDPELMALQRRMAALQDALTEIHAAESGVRKPTLPSAAKAAEEARPAGPTLTASKDTNAQDSWHGLLAGGGMALVGIALGIWLGALGRDGLSAWRQRKEL